MLATKYFKNSTNMVNFAKEFKQQEQFNWYLRTTLRCDHLINEKRKSIVLVNNETIIQRLISCRVCNTHGNAIDINAKKLRNGKQ